ncbi:MAG TPA: methyltransferase [Thermoplasmata archaeon]|nr:methyltransferase [Thermoplasmata archaeon]
MPAEDGADAPDHYFTERPRSASQRRELRFLFRGSVLVFEVDHGVFGSSGLDPGTALLIESLGVRPGDRVLDLGCGWGAVGVAAAKAAPEGRVIMTDVNRRAIALSRRNLRRNKIPNAEVRAGSLFGSLEGETFDVIATNPPFHAGRELILELLTAAPDHLADGGRLLVVGKGSQGIRFYQEWLAEHWAAEVTVLARGGGYRVIEARRRPAIDQA